MAVLFHMEQDYIEQDLLWNKTTKYKVCEVYKVCKVCKVYKVQGVEGVTHGSLVLYGARLYRTRLYCCKWNKTVLNKSFSISSKTCYVIKWFCSDA